MKKLLLFACVILLSGCAAFHMYPTVNYNVTQTQVVLDKANYKVVGRAEGVASATYVLGIGGMSEESLKGNAVDDMYRTAKLRGSQAIINVNFKCSIASYLSIVNKIEYMASGVIIEFIKDGAVEKKEEDSSNKIIGIENAEECEKLEEYKDSVVKIGSIVDYNGVAAMICQVRGSDVVLIAGGDRKGTWEEANQYCESIGEDWRLPSVDDFATIKLQLFYATSNIIDGFWTREEVSDNRALYFDTMYKTDYSTWKNRTYHIVAIAVVGISEL
ncbi:MAG: hypothetical protein J6V55_03475 [Alistipes sp.]|nr:hypothetical protein [Alistipes sp.]